MSQYFFLVIVQIALCSVTAKFLIVHVIIFRNSVLFILILIRRLGLFVCEILLRQIKEGAFYEIKSFYENRVVCLHKKVYLVKQGWFHSLPINDISAT